MKLIKALPAVAALSFASLLTTGCSLATPDAGHQIVLVEKPILFGHGGVDPTPVSTGSSVRAFTTDEVDVNMLPQQAHLELHDIMSSDGIPLSVDAVIRVQVIDSVKLISQFGKDWYNTMIEREFFNLVRQQIRTHGMNETAISATAIADIDAAVGKGMEQYIAKAGIPVRLIDVTVGKVNPPDAIKGQRIETAQQEQRVITMQQTKLAEDARKLAEESRADADNAYRNKMGMSPEQFLELEAIKMQERVCSGGAHCTYISNGSKTSPILDAR